MSINRLDRKKCRFLENSRVYKIITTIDEDPYWDEGLSFHKSKGWRNQSKAKRKKELLQYQVRMYKTWKHNRGNQWK